MRHHLDSLSQVVPPPLLHDHLVVDFASGNVMITAQGHIQEALVVSQVQIRLQQQCDCTNETSNDLGK